MVCWFLLLTFLICVSLHCPTLGMLMIPMGVHYHHPSSILQHPLWMCHISPPYVLFLAILPFASFAMPLPHLQHVCCHLPTIPYLVKGKALINVLGAVAGKSVVNKKGKNITKTNHTHFIATAGPIQRSQRIQGKKQTPPSFCTMKQKK